MRSTQKSVAVIGLTVGLAVGGATVPAHAMGTGGGGIPITTARTVDSQAVELQRVRVSVRAKGRVLKSAAPLLVTAEVPGETTAVEKRTRLGLPTWRVVVEMESGYKVAAFVHRRTGVIIDWVVLKVPEDVEYTPPKKDTKRPDLDPTKPKPAPVPAIVEDAIEAERQAATPAAPAPTSTSPASTGSDSDDDSRDDSRDESDDSRDGSDDDSGDDRRQSDSSDDSKDDDSEEDSRDSDRSDSSSDSRDDDDD